MEAGTGGLSLHDPYESGECAECHNPHAASNERLLAEDFLVESPTWAPNGRVLMFFRQQPSDRNGQGGDSKLYSIDLTGYNERIVETPVDASDPAWSPLNP